LSRPARALPLVLIACLALAAAPGARAESLLELLPPGEPLLPLDAHAIALGGAAEARWDLESGLPANPAQLVGIDGVSFATVLQVRRGLRDLAGPGADWDETRQDFPAFQISAALPRGLRLGIGYRADLRSRGSYHYSVPFPLEGETQHYVVRYAQSGGLSRFPFSLALPLGERYRAGVGLNLYRGNLSQEWTYDFPNPTSGDPDLGYQDRKVRRQASWYGTGLALGLQAQPLDPATVFSLRWDGGADLRGDAQEETAGEDDVRVSRVDGRMPARWALGAARRLPRGALGSVQWEHEAWTDYRAPAGSAKLSDVDRLCLGLEWFWGQAPAPGREGRQLPLRLGLRRGNWPAADPISGAEVTETTVSLGTGFDLPAGRGSLDLAFYWQALGMDAGESERRFGLALSLRTTETWSRRAQPF
jgi:hypothetical protein